MNQIIKNTIELSGRLKDKDKLLDSLLKQAQLLQQRLAAQNEYRDHLEEIGAVGRNHSRNALIENMIQEDKQISDLKNENKLLSACLEEHQSALDLIMSKYREHMEHFILHDSILSDPLPSHTSAKHVDLLNKVTEMAGVMRKSADLQEEGSNQLLEKLKALEVENAGLKQLVGIMGHYGSGPLSDDGASSDNSSTNGVSDLCERRRVRDLCRTKMGAVDESQFPYRPTPRQSFSEDPCIGNEPIDEDMPPDINSGYDTDLDENITSVNDETSPCYDLELPDENEVERDVAVFDVEAGMSDKLDEADSFYNKLRDNDHIDANLPRLNVFSLNRDSLKNSTAKEPTEVIERKDSGGKDDYTDDQEIYDTIAALDDSLGDLDGDSDDDTVIDYSDSAEF